MLKKMLPQKHNRSFFYYSISLKSVLSVIFQYYADIHAGHI